MQRCSGHNQHLPNGVASTRLAACKAVEFGHAPDGSLFFSDVRNLRIRAIRPDGIIETVAGTGEKCVASGPSDDPDNPPEEGCAEGLPATSSRINRPAGIAIGADETWYFADSQQHCIRQVDRQGILRAMAGICRPRSEGDGGGHRPRTGESGIATQMVLSSPSSLAVTPDGNPYIADSQGLSQVTPNGILLRVADFPGELFKVSQSPNTGYATPEDAQKACF